MKKILPPLFAIFFLFAFEIPSFAQKKILIVTDQSQSEKFVFKEGNRFVFRFSEKGEFITAVIEQISDSIITLRGKKFSNHFTIPVDRIKAIKSISGLHVFLRCVSVIVIGGVTAATFAAYAADAADAGTAALALVPIAVFSIPWFVPARVLHIGEKYKIEIRNK